MERAAAPLSNTCDFSRLSVGFAVLLLALWAPACSRMIDRLGSSQSRCPATLVPMGARCCAQGQSLQGGHCTGKPTQCPGGWLVSAQGRMGCVAPARPKHIDAGNYVVGPNDWESEHVLSEQGQVPAFWLDPVEVSWERFWPCVAARKCAIHTPTSGAYEPGQPVTEIDPGAARAFCTWAKGRLPRRAEWLRVAAGPSSNRFPWGQTGLVCRRAAFGLATGPCAEGGLGPEWTGARPDGRTAQGLDDLVGNVGELVEGDDGRIEIRGGSFRSDHAAVLKSWSVEPYKNPRDDVGFRCAYDTDPESG